MKRLEEDEGVSTDAGLSAAILNFQLEAGRESLYAFTYKHYPYFLNITSLDVC